MSIFLPTTTINNKRLSLQEDCPYSPSARRSKINVAGSLRRVLIEAEVGEPVTITSWDGKAMQFDTAALAKLNQKDSSFYWPYCSVLNSPEKATAKGCGFTNPERLC